MATKRKPKGARINTAGLGAQWRNRIVRSGEVTAAEIEMHPDNPKVHGEAQQGAMAAMLDDVGWVAPVVISDRSGRLLDGHMRVGLSATRGPIPAVWVDLDENEERIIVSSLDPIGAMAETDGDLLAKLTAGMETSIDLDDVLGALLPGDEEDVKRPITLNLGPLHRAHVLISVPLDQWPEIAAILEQLTAIEGVTYESTVN